MALVLMTWNLPQGEQLKAYNAKTKGWIMTLLKHPGVKEFRAYRNPLLTTPQVMIHSEYDSLASVLEWIGSEEYATIVSELRAVGCTKISAQIWGASPVVPQPLKPPSG
jgi:heme-degrading monooxygenase HmoA